MKETIEEFLGAIGTGKIDIYNEACLQHELALYLRNEGTKVKLEWPVTNFDTNWKKGDTVKKEIDLYLNGTIAVELKYPAKKKPANESFWQFLEDILFIEQLVLSKKYPIQKGYFLAVVDIQKKTFFDLFPNDILPKNITELYQTLYQIFRTSKTGIPKKKEVKCPIKRKQPHTKPLIFNNSYSIKWLTINNYKYILLEIS